MVIKDGCAHCEREEGWSACELVVQLLSGNPKRQNGKHFWCAWCEICYRRWRYFRCNLCRNSKSVNKAIKVFIIIIIIYKTIEHVEQVQACPGSRETCNPNFHPCLPMYHEHFVRDCPVVQTVADSSFSHGYRFDYSATSVHVMMYACMIKFVYSHTDGRWIL